MNGTVRLGLGTELAASSQSLLMVMQGASGSWVACWTGRIRAGLYEPGCDRKCHYIASMKNVYRKIHVRRYGIED